MSLAVFTARVSSRDTDRFDVTRKSGGPQGEPFAPSWAILRPALDARKEAERMHTMVIRAAEKATGGKLDRQSKEDGLAMLVAPLWAAYVPAYRLEMLASYRAHRAAWEALLARPRVVLCCYCGSSTWCHRRLLAGYLAKLGATDGGEL